MGLLFAVIFLAILSGVICQSADGTPIVTGYLNEDVILQCNCSNRDLQEPFKWQNEDKKENIFKSDKNGTTSIKYKNRIDVFQQEKNNCSLRLRNLTLNDSATYICSFRVNVYKTNTVILDVIPRLTAAQKKGPAKPTRQNFTIIPVIVLLLVVGCLWNFYLKRRKNWQEQNQVVTLV